MTRYCVETFSKVYNTYAIDAESEDGAREDWTERGVPLDEWTKTWVVDVWVDEDEVGA